LDGGAVGAEGEDGGEVEGGGEKGSLSGGEMGGMD